MKTVAPELLDCGPLVIMIPVQKRILNHWPGENMHRRCLCETIPLPVFSEFRPLADICALSVAGHKELGTNSASGDEN